VAYRGGSLLEVFSRENTGPPTRRMMRNVRCGRGLLARQGRGAYAGQVREPAVELGAHAGPPDARRGRRIHGRHREPCAARPPRRVRHGGPPDQARRREGAGHPRGAEGQCRHPGARGSYMVTKAAAELDEAVEEIAQPHLSRLGRGGRGGRVARPEVGRGPPVPGVRGVDAGEPVPAPPPPEQGRQQGGPRVGRQGRHLASPRAGHDRRAVRRGRVPHPDGPGERPPRRAPRTRRAPRRRGRRAALVASPSDEPAGSAGAPPPAVTDHTARYACAMSDHPHATTQTVEFDVELEDGNEGRLAHHLGSARPRRPRARR